MIRNNPDACCYCGACVGVCPQLALELADTRLIYYQEKCTDCLACVRVCPVGAMSQVKK